MTPLLRLAIRIALMTVVVGFMFMERASAQEDQFRRGIQARENKQWQVVISRMREAIAIRGQESPGRIGAVLGIGGTEYLPHYFLAEALFNTGDCGGAVTEWAASEQQGAVQKARSEYMRTMRDGYAECEKKGVLLPGRLEKELARLSQLIAEATRLGTGLSNLFDANPEILRGEPGIRDQYDRARGEIENARGRYEAARSSRLQSHIDAGAAAIDRARPILVTTEASFRAVIDTRRSAQSLIKEVQDAIALAEGLNTAVDSKKVPFTPQMTTAQQEGRDLLQRARERLAEGQKSLNPPALTAARTYAVDSQNRFRLVLDETTRIEKGNQQQLFTDAIARAQEAFSLMDNAVGTLQRFSTERPNVVPKDQVDTVLREVERVRRRLDAARRQENPGAVTSAGQAASVQLERLTALIGAFGPLTLRDRGVREQLETGARQYLGGEYQQAVATLGVSESLEPDVPLRLHFHLFKAASLYELFLRSRETDQALRAQALAEVEHCKGIASAFQPDGRAFSPRFLAFYQSVPAPAAPLVAAPAPTAGTPPGAQ